MAEDNVEVVTAYVEAYNAGDALSTSLSTSWQKTSRSSRMRPVSLSCFARHVDPPEAKFPRAPEVVELSTDSEGHEVGLEAVMDLLIARRAGPMIVG